MVKVLVDMDETQLNSLVVLALKEAYWMNVNPSGLAMDDETFIDTDFLKSVEHVMQYFMNEEQLDQWNKERNVEWDKV